MKGKGQLGFTTSLSSIMRGSAVFCLTAMRPSQETTDVILQVISQKLMLTSTGATWDAGSLPGEAALPHLEWTASVPA